MHTFFEKRKEFIPPVVISALLICFIFACVYFLSGQLLSEKLPEGGFFAYSGILAKADTGSFFWNLIYSLTDISNGPFFTDFYIALFMLVSASIARALEKMKAPAAGTGTEGSGYRFKWLVFTQLSAMTLANLIWRHLFQISGSIPTFACAFSVAPISVLYYGKPDLKKAVTGILLGAFLPVFAVRFLLTHVVSVYALPGFVGVGTGMALSTILSIELFNHLPWMIVNPNPGYDPTIVIVDNRRKSALWLTLTRVFGGDISELYFWGASVSGFFVILGAFVTWCINPYGNANGISLMPMLFTFMITSCLSVFIWGPKLQKDGFAFTFEPLLVVGSLYPYCSNPIILIITVIAAVIIAPNVIHFALSTSFFKRYHASVTVQLFGALMTLIGYLILHLL